MGFLLHVIMTGNALFEEEAALCIAIRILHVWSTHSQKMKCSKKIALTQEGGQKKWGTIINRNLRDILTSCKVLLHFHRNPLLFLYCHPMKT